MTGILSLTGATSGLGLEIAEVCGEDEDEILAAQEPGNVVT